MEEVFSFAGTILGTEDEVAHDFFLLWETLSADLFVVVDLVELSLVKRAPEPWVERDWKLLEAFWNEPADWGICLGFCTDLELTAGLMQPGGDGLITGFMILDFEPLLNSSFMPVWPIAVAAFDSFDFTKSFGFVDFEFNEGRETTRLLWRYISL